MSIAHIGRGRLKRGYSHTDNMATAMRRLRFMQRSFMLHHTRHNSVVSAYLAPDSAEKQESLYPPIKPKYPPGQQWGSMTPEYAWLWHRRKEESIAIGDVRERTKALCEEEMSQLVYKVREFYPRSLSYHKYVTKTRVVDGIPNVYQPFVDAAKVDALVARLSPIVSDIILMETDQLERKNYLQTGFFSYRTKQSCLLVRNILGTLVTEMAAEFPHLQTAQYDENVTIAAFWDRHGFQRKSRVKHPKRFIIKDVLDKRISSSTGILNFILRSTKPLPEFVERDDALCKGSIPQLQPAAPMVYGQKEEKKAKRKVIAGHVYGDPCEFGLLSINETVWSRQLTRDYGEQHAKDSRLCQGIGSSFVWLVAQAYNQGFNTVIDLTYPLSTQTVLTDGKTWQFLFYQLNTLALWLDDEANSRVNICWRDEEKDLFVGIENGKVVGFNPDILRQLIMCLALAPADRPYSLQPTLPQNADDPKEKKDFIPPKPIKVEVVKEIKYVI